MNPERPDLDAIERRARALSTIDAKNTRIVIDYARALESENRELREVVRAALGLLRSTEWGYTEYSVRHKELLALSERAAKLGGA